MELNDDWEVVDDAGSEHEWEVVETAPSRGRSLEGLRSNAMNDLSEMKNAALGLYQVAKNYTPLTQAPSQLAGMVMGEGFQPTPYNRDAKIIKETAKGLPGAIIESVTRLRNPVNAFYEKPITTAIDVATLGSAAKPLAQVGKSAAQAVGRGAARKIFSTPVGRRFLSASLGPSEEAIAARLERPQAILKAKSSADLADDLAMSARTIEGQIGEGSKVAAKTLNPDLFNSPGVQTKGTVLKRISTLQNELKTGGVVVGEAEQLAFKKLEALKKRISAMTDGKKGLFNDRISEQNVEGIIKSIDPDINWDSPLNSVANQKLMRLRTLLDRSLKIKNPAYREAMKPVSERMGTLEGLKRKFNLRPGDKGELVPENVTASNLEQAINEKKIVSQDLLGDVKKFTGRDYVKEVRDWKMAEQFLPGSTRPQGSRRVNWGGGTGAAIGGLVGGVPGAAIGAVGGVMAGGYMDKQGGAIAGKLIDMYLKSQGPRAVSAVNPIAAEYGPALVDAVEKTGLTLEEATTQLRKTDSRFDQFIFEVLQPEKGGKAILKERIRPQPILKPLGAVRVPRSVGNTAEDINAIQEPLKVLDESMARTFLKQANGDKNLARKLAREAGYQW